MFQTNAFHGKSDENQILKKNRDDTWEKQPFVSESNNVIVCWKQHVNIIITHSKPRPRRKAFF